MLSAGPNRQVQGPYLCQNGMQAFDAGELTCHLIFFT